MRGRVLALWLAAASGGIVDGRLATAKEPATAKVATTAVDFARDVFPIFRRSCIECHGPEKQEGDLRLDIGQDALASGSLSPGAPDHSELLRRIRLPQGHDEVMPAIGQPLTKQQVSTIRRWIEQGADWPEQVTVGRHWAYVAPTRPQLPEVSRPEWCRTPIDRFILQRLDAEGLPPSPRAAPEKLIRRVYLDLIGLPPTPEEVRAFAADPTDERFAAVVDELLQRPQFGERWARPWLDLARYADSHGFQRDNLWEIWAYRDWVIRALNADMPFDQFTIEQLAGDLLPNATESQKIATGFHRCTPTNVEAGSIPEETRAEQVLDRVNTTGAVWLGTTLECCQCHDHKYDPFTQRDYYKLFAYFNSTELEADRTNPKTPSSIQFQGPSMPLADAARDMQRGELQTQLTAAREEQTQRRQRLDRELETWVTQYAATIADAPQTQTLDVVEFRSEGTTDSYEQLDDGSILLLGGDPPERDVYTLTVRSQPLHGVRAIRLDALQDKSLPGGGPGRGEPKRTNFVLNEFTVELCTPTAANAAEPLDRTPLTFVSASASFAQKNYDPLGAVDGNAKSGWAIAPQFDKSHWATFVLAEPIDLTEQTTLAVTLSQQFGQSRTIGRFRLSAIVGDVEGESVPKELVAAVAKPAAQWTPDDRRRLLDQCVALDRSSRQLAASVKKLEKQIGEIAPDTTLVMVELPEPRMSAIFGRGDYKQPGETVQPGTPEILSPPPAGPANRLTLARWLVADDNPLTARVTVNRWWAELFGQGIVPTVEDFGLKGEPPSHPELLDWLAVELRQQDWSTKRLLRTIVLSSTYQQSSHFTPELRERDDQNRLLARGPRLRMDAEMIRDNALAVSGLLNLQQFGPPIRPYQPDGLWNKVGGTNYTYEVSPGSEQHRRGIYVVLKRGSPYPSFVNFDATARLACTVQRSRTNTPLQALTLLNDPVYVEAAGALAARVQTTQAGRPLDEQLSYAFQLCTGRQPAAAELAALRDLYQSQLVVEQQQSAPSAETAAWHSVASVLLNLHETVTKD